MSQKKLGASDCSDGRQAKSCVYQVCAHICLRKLRLCLKRKGQLHQLFWTCFINKVQAGSGNKPFGHCIMTKLGGGFKDCVFSPLYTTRGNDPIWRAYFSDGLKPPTRKKHCMKLTPPEWELQKNPAPASSEALCRARMKQSHKLQSRVVSDYMPIFWRSLFRILIIQSLCGTYVAIIGSMIFRIMLKSTAANGRRIPSAWPRAGFARFVPAKSHGRCLMPRA